MNKIQETTTIIPVQSEIVEIPVAAIGRMQQQIHLLKDFVSSQLQEGSDYGRVPGCGPKPALLKPGAEKLLRLFNLGSRIISKQEMIDWDKKRATFCYCIEIFNLKTGQAIAQCEGYTSSEERKYAKGDMGSQLNTLSKMAQKRAMVGAVLIATSASDFFVADIEDLEVSHNASNTASNGPRTHEMHPAEYGAHKHKEEACTEPQRKKLYAMSKAAGLAPEEAKDFMQEHTRKASSEDLTKGEIQILFEKLDEIIRHKDATSHETDFHPSQLEQ